MENEQNISPFQFVNDSKNQPSEVIVNNEEKSNNIELEEAFVTGLPDWDLLPPYETIRRVNRK